MNIIRTVPRLCLLVLLVAAAAPATGQLLPRLLDRVRDRVHDVGDALRDRHRHRHTHGDACRRWIPPRCETITERIWVPGRCERVWVPPEYREICDPWGRHQRVLVRCGYWRTIEHPGHWESRTRTVQAPGRWEYVCGH